MSRYSFRGTLTLTAPLHVAEPGASRYLVDQREFRDYGQGWPATRTRRMRVMGDRPVEIPYFPSNDFRGRLRRKAHSLIIDSFIQRGEKLSLEAYHVLSCGAVTGQPMKGSAYVLADILHARSHLFMGLFGGGPRLYASGVRTYDLLPRLLFTEQAGLVPARGDGEPASPEVPPSDLLYAMSITRRDDLLRMVDERHGKVIAEWPISLTNWSGQVVESRAKRKADAEKGESNGARKADLDNMATYEVVAAGTQLYVQVDIAPHLGEAHAGLIAHAFASLANENAIGGKTALGWGRFSLALQLFDGDEPVHNVLVHDKSTVTVSDDMAEFTDAYSEALGKVDRKDVERFTAGAVDAAA